MFPPLIERRGARSGQGGPEDRVKECDKIHWPLPADVKTDRSREQDEKRKARLYQLREVRHRPAAFGRGRRWFNHRGLHPALASARFGVR